MPQRVGIYEHGQTAYIVNGHLKVMLEEDYLSLQKHEGIQDVGAGRWPAQTMGNKGQPSGLPLHNQAQKIGTDIVREIVLPALEKEINNGKNFATLHQIFYAQALAVWFKRNLKQALLNRVYANKGTVKGIDQNNPQTNEAIFGQYLKAYKKGVFNYIKEDIDAVTKESLPRKYFSGGYFGDGTLLSVTTEGKLPNADIAQIGKEYDFSVLAATPKVAAALAKKDPAMNAGGNKIKKGESFEVRLGQIVRISIDVPNEQIHKRWIEHFATGSARIGSGALTMETVTPLSSSHTIGLYDRPYHTFSSDVRVISDGNKIIVQNNGNYRVVKVSMDYVTIGQVFKKRGINLRAQNAAMTTSPQTAAALAKNVQKANAALTIQENITTRRINELLHGVRGQPLNGYDTVVELINNLLLKKSESTNELGIIRHALAESPFKNLFLKKLTEDNNSNAKEVLKYLTETEKLIKVGNSWFYSTTVLGFYRKLVKSLNDLIADSTKAISTTNIVGLQYGFYSYGRQSRGVNYYPKDDDILPLMRSISLELGDYLTLIDRIGKTTLAGSMNGTESVLEVKRITKNIDGKEYSVAIFQGDENAKEMMDKAKKLQEILNERISDLTDQILGSDAAMRTASGDVFNIPSGAKFDRTSIDRKEMPPESVLITPVDPKILLKNADKLFSDKVLGYYLTYDSEYQGPDGWRMGVARLFKVKFFSGEETMIVYPKEVSDVSGAWKTDSYEAIIVLGPDIKTPWEVRALVTKYLNKLYRMDNGLNVSYNSIQKDEKEFRLRFDKLNVNKLYSDDLSSEAFWAKLADETKTTSPQTAAEVAKKANAAMTRKTVIKKIIYYLRHALRIPEGRVINEETTLMSLGYKGTDWKFIQGQLKELFGVYCPDRIAKVSMTVGGVGNYFLKNQRNFTLALRPEFIEWSFTNEDGVVEKIDLEGAKAIIAQLIANGILDEDARPINYRHPSFAKLGLKDTYSKIMQERILRALENAANPHIFIMKDDMDRAPRHSLLGDEPSYNDGYHDGLPIPGGGHKDEAMTVMQKLNDLQRQLAGLYREPSHEYSTGSRVDLNNSGGGIELSLTPSHHWKTEGRKWLIFTFTPDTSKGSGIFNIYNRNGKVVWTREVATTASLAGEVLSVLINDIEQQIKERWIDTRVREQAEEARVERERKKEAEMQQAILKNWQTTLKQSNNVIQKLTDLQKRLTRLYYVPDSETTGGAWIALQNSGDRITVSLVHHHYKWDDDIFPIFSFTPDTSKGNGTFNIYDRSGKVVWTREVATTASLAGEVLSVLINDIEQQIKERWIDTRVREQAEEPRVERERKEKEAKKQGIIQGWESLLSQDPNSAMTGKPKAFPGGIDLSQQDSAMTVTRDANGGVKVDINPALIARIEREGMPEVDPVIIGMRPVDLKTLFGVGVSISAP